MVYGQSSFRRLADAFSFLFMPATAQVQNFRVNNPAEDTYSAISQTEESIGVSRWGNQRTIVVGFNDSALFPTTITGFAVSTDGGGTWQDRGGLMPAPGGYNGGDPVVVGDASGQFYFGHLEQTAPRQDPTARVFIAVNISSDGFSFGGPYDASPGTPTLMQHYTQDKPQMAVDNVTGSGNIYVCWSEHTIPPLAYGRRIRFSRSTDHGLHYSNPPLILTDLGTGAPGTPAPTGCSIAVGPGPHGDVYVAWYDAEWGNMQVLRSTDQGLNFFFTTDGGQTFQYTPCCPYSKIGCATQPPLPQCQTFAHADAPPDDAACGTLEGALNGHVRNGPLANLATDPLVDGYVYAVFDHYDYHGTPPSSDIMFSRSINYGATWSAMPMRLNDVTTGDQFQPTIATRIYQTQTSLIRVIWYDRRRDPANLAYDIYSNTSQDHGVNWQTNGRVTNVSQPMPLPTLAPNFDCQGGLCYFGDYIGLNSTTANGGSFIGAWGDTRDTASGTPCAHPSPTPAGPATSPDPNVYSALGC